MMLCHKNVTKDKHRVSSSLLLCGVPFVYLSYKSTIKSKIMLLGMLNGDIKLQYETDWNGLHIGTILLSTWCSNYIMNIIL